MAKYVRSIYYFERLWFVLSLRSYDMHCMPACAVDIIYMANGINGKYGEFFVELDKIVSPSVRTMFACVVGR